jgi:hypothetical protein
MARLRQAVPMIAPPTPGTGLVAPLPRQLHRVLRRAVKEEADHHAGRRLIDTRLHVGLPGGPQRVHPVRPGETDHTLRIEIVTAMTARIRQSTGALTPMVWLSRLGPLSPTEDVDLDWLAAAGAAFAELDLPLIFLIVDRHGWRDPRTGLARHWTRLRSP